MKKLSTLLCLLFIATFSFAQNTFIKYFNTAYYNLPAYNIISVSNQAFVALGNSTFNKNSHKWDIDFVKFDLSGNVLIQKKISTDYSSGDPKGIATKDGGYALFVAEQQPANESGKRLWGAAIIKLNSKGEVEWSKYYNSTLFRHINTDVIIESRSGDFIVQYSLGNDEYITNNMGIIKISNTGNIIWQTSLKQYSLWYWEYFGNSILEGSNGKIYIGGYLQIEDPSLGFRSTILQLGENGHLEKSFYFSSGGEADFQLFRLFEVKGGMAVYGTYSFDLSLDSSRAITATKMSFRYLLKRKYPQLRPQQYGGNLYPKDGSIVQVGAGLDIQGGGISVSKHDSLFRVCPDYIPSTYVENLSTKIFKIKHLEVIPINDIVTVSELNAYDSTIDFVQTFCTGDVPPQFKPGTFTQEKLSNISIYPNPVENILHVQNLKAEEKYQLRIMNNLGNVFKESTVENASTYDFNLSGLKAGLYYLKVQSGNINASFIFIKK